MPQDPDDRIETEPEPASAGSDAGPARENAARGSGAAHDRRAIGHGPQPKPPAATRRRPLDSAARARIGRGLRLHYADVLALPVPERLLALIDDLGARSDPEVPR